MINLKKRIAELRNYPVYSSQTTNEGIIGSINSYDYDCKCITWTTDGTYVGTTFLREGKFSMTTHCGGLLLKEEYNKEKDGKDGKGGGIPG